MPQPASHRRRRVHFSPGDEDFSNSNSLSESTSFEFDHGLQLHIQEYDPQISCENAGDIFYSDAEILQIRRDVRKIAQRFAADYPDFVETIEDVYDQGEAVDLTKVHKTLRRRRKRVAAMELSRKWENLFNEFDDDGNVFGEEDDATTEDALKADDYYCDDEDAPENHLNYGVTRGLEARMSSAARLRRKQGIHGVLQLQEELRENSAMDAGQIEMCLCAKAVHLTRKARAFACNQAKLDRMDLQQ